MEEEEERGVRDTAAQAGAGRRRAILGQLQVILARCNHADQGARVSNSSFSPQQLDEIQFYVSQGTNNVYDLMLEHEKAKKNTIQGQNRTDNR